MQTEKVLLAGATGYLGKYVANELVSQGYHVKALVRDKTKVNFNSPDIETTEAQVTDPKSLTGILNDVDFVISTVGITKQKDGLTYMDVDYQANKNLLDEAKKAGIKKFVYVASYKGNEMRHLKMIAAKEKFVDELNNSGIDYCVLRPTGFFSDLAEFLTMANKGTVWLFGDGSKKMNPIHGEDLAVVVVNSLKENNEEINVGGPDTFKQTDIARLAFNVLGKSVKVKFVPDWVRRLTISLVRTFTSQKTYGPVEFFLTAMAEDMNAPKYGKRSLASFYEKYVKDNL